MRRCAGLSGWPIPGRGCAALTALLADLRTHAAGHVDKALAALERADPRSRPAFVALALVRPYLRQLAKDRLFHNFP